MKAHQDRDVYIKFFPSDWRGDESLKMCSLAARGLWIELMCLAHRSDGYVRIGGKVPDSRILARQVGSTPREVDRLTEELMREGVCSKAGDGAIYSRRMVRDLKRRAVNQANGRNGGNPRLTESDNQTEPNSDNRTAQNSVKPYIPEPVAKLDPEPEKAPTRELFALFDELHQRRFENSAEFNKGKDAGILTAIWKKRGQEQTEALIRAFFEMRDPWVLQRGFSVGIFQSQIPKLLANLPKNSAPTRDWYDECREFHGGACGSGGKHAIQMDLDAGRAERAKASA